MVEFNSTANTTPTSNFPLAAAPREERRRHRKKLAGCWPSALARCTYTHIAPRVVPAADNALSSSSSSLKGSPFGQMQPRRRRGVVELAKVYASADSPITHALARKACSDAAANFSPKIFTALAARAMDIFAYNEPETKKSYTRIPVVAELPPVASSATARLRPLFFGGGGGGDGAADLPGIFFHSKIFEA